MDDDIADRFAKMELRFQSHVTAYNFLFSTVLSTLLAEKSETEFAATREYMLDRMRFNMKSVPDEVPNSLQIQANAISYLEWLLNVVDDTRKANQRETQSE